MTKMIDAARIPSQSLLADNNLFLPNSFSFGVSFKSFIAHFTINYRGPAGFELTGDDLYGHCLFQISVMKCW